MGLWIRPMIYNAETISQKIVIQANWNPCDLEIIFQGLESVILVYGTEFWLYIWRKFFWLVSRRGIKSDRSDVCG